MYLQDNNPRNDDCTVAVALKSTWWYESGVSQPARRQATYSDIVALPTGIVGEIVDGQLYTYPRPRYYHSRVGAKLGIAFGVFDHTMHGPNDPGGWLILDEPELHLGHDIVVPDLAAWRIENISWEEDAAYIEVAPDWICEILSPSTEVFDRAEKMPCYAQHGVPWVWLIEPEEKCLEVYRLDAGVLRQHGQVFRGHVLVVAPPFEQAGIEMWRVWGLGD